MTFTLSHIVPWGRSFDEYRRMFALTEGDLSKPILSCADGPASFNSEMHRQGHHVVSVDPIYGCAKAEIRARIDETYEEVLAQARRNRDNFVWTTIRSVDALGRTRMSSMNQFLDDYEPGRRQGRYVAGALPDLPFVDNHFDLALCSHFLFLYTDQFSLARHMASIEEMRRVAREVRIFPLVDLDAKPSPYRDPIVAACRERGMHAEVVKVPYEFQRSADEMLQIN
jgi:hypothetical protein